MKIITISVVVTLTFYKSMSLQHKITCLDRTIYSWQGFILIALYRHLIVTFTGNNMKSENFKCIALYRHTNLYFYRKQCEI